VRQKEDIVLLEKKEMQLFICGSSAYASDHAVFPAAVNKNKFYCCFCDHQSPLTLFAIDWWNSFFKKKIKKDSFI
jgi:hypothetical protein